jgi:hypothetical protein
MGSVIRTRVEDCHIAIADDVGAGTREGEWSLVRCENTPHARRDLIDTARGNIEVAIKGDIIGHERRAFRARGL